MAVIINDFEITVEAPANSAEGNAPAGPAREAQPPMRPDEIARIERRYRERRKRLKAD